MGNSPVATPIEARKPRLGARLVAGVLALVLLSTAAGGYVLWRSWAHEIDSARVEADNTAILLERDLAATLDKVNVALGSIAAQLERERQASDFERRTLWPLVDGVRALVPEVIHVGVFDAHGRQVCGVPLARCERLDVGDRDYFRALRADPATSRTVYGPVRNRMDGRWSLVLAQPLHDAAGGFVGVASAIVPLDTFKARIASLDLGASGAVSIRMDDLRLAMQHPGPLRSDDEADNRKVSPELVRALASGGARGTYRAVSRLDGVEREYAYRRLPRLGLVVEVGLGTQEALAHWRDHASWTIAFLLVFVGTSALVLSLLLKALRQQERLQDELEDRVERRTKQLRRLAGELEMAENRERQQIARDLHDDLGQTLAAARIRLEPLCTSGVEDVRRAACRIAQLVEQADRSTRALAAQLAPAVLYELGLAPALERLGEDIRRNFGMEVTVVDDGQAKPLSAEARSILYRCARELLVNAAKHARSPHAEVEIEARDGHIAVRVADAGVGFPTAEPHEGAGLRSVRERLSYIGGSFHIESLPGDGTVAVLTAPLAPSAPAAPGQRLAMPSRTA